MPGPWLPAKQAFLDQGMAKGYVLHEGPSPFDGQPIVSIATLHSNNRKTGDMVQTWILPRDLHPLDAVKAGQDSCICGNCPHRGCAGKYPEFRKNPRTPKEMTNEICIEFKTEMFC